MKIPSECKDVRDSVKGWCENSLAAYPLPAQSQETLENTDAPPFQGCLFSRHTLCGGMKTGPQYGSSCENTTFPSILIPERENSN